MSKNSIIGVLGGALIALSVFFSGDTATFNSSALSDTTALVLFIAGLAVIIFVLISNYTWAAYSTVAAATIALIAIIDLLRGGDFDLSVGFVVLVVGVILAIVATVTHKRS